MSTLTTGISRRILIDKRRVEIVAQRRKNLNTGERRLPRLAVDQIEFVFETRVKSVAHRCQFGQQTANNRARRGHRRHAILKARFAQQAAGIRRPGHHDEGVQVWENAQIGEAQIFQITCPHRHPTLNVEAQMAQQKVQAICCKALEMARGHRLGAADAMRVSLLETNEFDARLIELALQSLQARISDRKRIWLRHLFPPCSINRMQGHIGCTPAQSF